MVKNYFLNVFACITPFEVLASLHTVGRHQNPNQFAITGLKI